MKKLLTFTLAVLILAASATALEEHYIFPLQDKHVHASSLVETSEGDILAAWFHGSGERWADDVAVLGSRLRKGADAWEPVFTMADTPDFPDCNPVLFIDSQERLWLFWVVVLANRWENCLLKYRRADVYNEDGAPHWNWQDIITFRPDDGFPDKVKEAFKALDPQEDLWAEYAPPYSELIVEATRDSLKRQIGWMTRNHPLELPTGRILLPLYHDGLNICLMGISDDVGENWTISEPIMGLGHEQPTVARRSDGSLLAYFRDSGPKPYRTQYATSADDGETWSLTEDTDIPNPSSSMEILALQDGRWIMIANDLEDGRHRLGMFLSTDEGRSWPVVRYLDDNTEDCSFSYPSLIQGSDGRIHASYSYKVPEGKTIKHVSFMPDWIESEDVERADRPEEATPVADDAPVVDDAPEPVETTRFTPTDGASLVEHCAATLASWKSFAVNYNTTFVYTRGSINQEAFMEGDMVLGEGNLGRIHIKRQDSDTITYNSPAGQFVVAPALNKYTPMPLAASRKNLVATMTTGTVEPLLALFGELLEGQVPPLDTLSFTETEVNEKAVWNLKGESSDYFLNMTLPVTGPVVPLSLTMNFKEPLINKYNFPADAALSIVMNFSEWSPEITVVKEDFDFVAADDAQSATLAELSTKPKIEVGQPAPDFSLDDMDGNSFRLQEHIGKEVILLEFWSTNCTVCQRLAPELNTFAQAMAGEDVGIYGINLRATPEAIEYFFKEDIPVYPILMDRNGSAGKLYDATSVPRMVLIGKDGLIKGVYRGMPEGIINTLTEKIRQLQTEPADSPAEEAKIVVGAQAPDFTLGQMDGDEIRLSALTKEHPVVLAFWASYCGYCKRALPIVLDVMNSFQDKGVVFYGVNQRENPEKIKAYFDDADLSFPVLLDTDAQVGGSYEIRGIPRIVIVGKDGIIKGVHQGLQPNLAELLNDQLSKLI
ncbi:MAG: exo-alpha-sialidase [Candidatus Hydrogenedentales bacterium]